MPRLLAALLAMASLAVPGVGRADTLAVAAASSLRAPLEEIVAAFRKQNPGTDVRVSYGASGTLVAQITNGAPFDLFFSADEVYPRKLVEAGAAVPESVTRYATGRLVLWLPRDAGLSPDAGIAVLRDARIKRIAIANPAHAPYGRAAEEALRASGLLETVRPRLVLGEDVSQAAQFAERGNADAALLPVTVARLPALERAGRYAVLPSSLHRSLDQDAVVIARTRNKLAATALLRFTVGPEGRAILARSGFELPRR